ncbi:MAG: M23 family metallopeptidase [Rhodospirillales bacterium]|nr:M23 family metallopeptidase [Rhodospirillales bacterium]
MDQVCSIQKYVDHDPGPERMDYACGRLSKDGDTGTDFRVPDYPTMERGVAVVAAAPGVVSAVRDGMEDVSVAEIGHEAIRGRWAGNGVVVDHGNGFETQYSHLRRGSVAVAVGQRVTTGETLGLIGLSGNTEFPHLNFSVRYRGRPVDPFVGLSAFTNCGDPRKPLWSAAAAARLPYRATVLLKTGFAGERPDPRAARHGAYDNPLPASAEALVFWVDVSGAMAGDRERFLVTGPGGATLMEREQRISDSNISWFSFAGLRRPPGGWPAGVVTASYALIRDGAPVVSASRTIAFE